MNESTKVNLHSNRLIICMDENSKKKYACHSKDSSFAEYQISSKQIRYQRLDIDLSEECNF